MERVSELITNGETKKVPYDALVEARKACRQCAGLTNPSECEDGAFDCDAIGEWSRWQGNLNAPLMIVGQDWGDVQWFVREKGHSTDTSKTNRTLLELLASIGFNLKLPSHTRDGILFFTNAVLCLKGGGAQAPVRPEWLRNCGRLFLRPTIELVQPKVVVCLGARAYRAVLGAWEIKPRKLIDAVTSKDHPVVLLPLGLPVFPVYHCGARTQNTNRNIVAQREDWKRIGDFLSL